MDTAPVFPGQQHEYCVLLRHCASVQARCDRLITAQAAEIEQLQRECFRLRAELMIRHTRLAWMQQDLAEFKAAVPDLPKRQELLVQVRQLLHRVQDLMREKLQWQHAQQTPNEDAGHVGMTAGASPLAESLLAADLVICQAGCISHDDYWREQESCRRTGRPCFLAGQEGTRHAPPVFQQEASIPHDVSSPV